MTEKISLKIGGLVVSGWKSVSISRATNALCSSFELSFDGDRQISCGEACELWIGKELILAGYIDSKSGSLDDASLNFTIRGRDKTADLIDCSAMGKNSFANQKIDAIAKALAAPFGLNIVVGEGTNLGPAFPKFAIEQGESPFEALSRLAKQRGLLLTSNAKGELVITSPNTFRVFWALSEGVNILAATFEDDAKDRFSEYHVRGGQSGQNDNNTKPARATSGLAKDPTIARYRPKLIISDEQSSSSGLSSRAAFEATAAAAAGQNVTIEVASWRAPDGKLWELGTLAQVKIPSLTVDMDLIITQITFNQDEKSCGASLKFARQESFKAEPLPEPKSRKPKKTSKSNGNGELKK